jgi:hypothetical protein
MKTAPTLEEMVCHTYKGLLCKICEADRFGKLFRLAYNTKKSPYGCHKCIVSLLESKIGSDSDENKILQDLINQIKS